MIPWKLNNPFRNTVLLLYVRTVYVLHDKAPRYQYGYAEIYATSYTIPRNVCMRKVLFSPCFTLWAIVVSKMGIS